MLEPIVKSEGDKRQTYVLVYNYLYNLIIKGYFKPGDKLPGEHTLAKELGISRSTLRQALILLQEDGWISARQGKGAYVLPNERSNRDGLEKVYNAALVNAKQEVIRRNCKIYYDSCSDKVQQDLQVSSHELVATFEHLYYCGEKPCCHVLTITPYSFMAEKGINLKDEELLLDYSERVIYQIAAYATTTIQITRAGTYWSECLSIPEKEPLLLLDELLFQAEGKPLAFSKKYCVPEYYEFNILRK